MPYSEALALQESIAKARKAGALKFDVALSLQHSSVYTLGKRACPATDLLSSPAAVAARASAEVFVSPRGGQATWHGPGQAVLYPVLLLKGNRVGVRKYMEELEASLVSVSSGLGVEGARVGSGSGSPGAWVDVPSEEGGDGLSLPPPPPPPPAAAAAAKKRPLKIGAVGVRVSGGVATNGAALNVSPDLRAFAAIVPCGDEGAAPTSVEAELARKGRRTPLDVSEIGVELAEELAGRLGYERAEHVAVEELKEELRRLGF